jgi:tetratricopeptide (TPR) repeat protein
VALFRRRRDDGSLPAGGIGSDGRFAGSLSAADIGSDGRFVGSPSAADIGSDGRFVGSLSAGDIGSDGRFAGSLSAGDIGSDGRFVGSLSKLRRAARAGDPEAMANLGTALCQSGRYAEGTAWLEKAWRAGNVVAGFNLGTFAQTQGHLNRAEVIWTEIAATGDVDAMLCLARLALGRGDHDEAARWMEPILGQEDTFPVCALGVAFRDSGDEATAMRLFHTAIAGGDPYAMDYAARIYDARGETEHAAQLRSRAEDLRTVEANRRPPVLGY